MCTYYRTIKDGSVKEFKFEFNQNIYSYRHSEIEFHFTVYDDYAAFTIDTARFTNMGYGTALLSIMFEIINEKISGGMFDTIRHPFFCIIYVRLTEEFKF